MKTKGTFFAYLDTIGVPSEVNFLKRFYVGFQEMDPYWLGWRLERDADALPQPKVILGREGILRGVDRLLFKVAAKMPPRPHLWHFKPRLIHAHFGRGGALALPVARMLKVPLVVTFHGGDATKDNHYRRGLVPTVYQQRLTELQNEAAAFHCVSDYIRETLLRRGFPAEKLFVMRTGVELAVPDPQPPPLAEPYILFAGRFVEKKGIAHLLDAMRVLRGQGETVPLVLIGDGPLAGSLKSRADGIADVRFLGWRPNEEVRQWMRGAAAVCVPSLMAESGDSEGLGHVAMEAMEAATPVIGSRHGGLAELVEHDVTGLLVPPGEPTALADAIRRVITNADLARRFGDQGRQRLTLHFDAVRQSQALENRFLELLEGQKT